MTQQAATQEKPVFKTMIDVSEESRKHLAGWREPRHAYILFEKVEYQIQPDYTYKRGTGLFTFNVEARAEHQAWKLADYQKKGFRVIHYGNFPKLDDKSPQRAARARLYSGPNQKNPWDALEADVLRAMAGNPDVAQKLKDREAEVEALKAERDALEAKLQAATVRTKKEARE